MINKAMVCIFFSPPTAFIGLDKGHLTHPSMADYDSNGNTNNLCAANFDEPCFSVVIASAANDYYNVHVFNYIILGGFVGAVVKWRSLPC